jgi:hypothetical protein
MEFIIFLTLGLVIGYFALINKKASKSNITKINDTNWAINGELISFDKNIPLEKLKQEAEDNEIYNTYETERLIRDRIAIFENYRKTKQAISVYAKLGNCVTDEKLKLIESEYNDYLVMCKKLKINECILSKRDFLIQKENPVFCHDFSSQALIHKHIGIYHIYNKDTARYYNGNMTEILENEFKNKWY